MYPVLSGGFKLNFDGSSKCLLGFLKEEQGGSAMLWQGFPQTSVAPGDY